MKSLLFVLSVILLACEQAKTPAVNQERKININGTGKLIPIDFSDTNYVDVILYANDTITPAEWLIKYFVKDDSTKYSDLYIEWSKGNRKGIYKMERVLELRRYFIPEYEGETDKFLFLSHACATSCSAILVLSKDSSLSAYDYQNIVEYNIPLEKVVYVTERSFQRDSLQVAIVDLTRQKKQTVFFDNVCPLSPEYGCIDSVIFKRNETIVVARLTDRKDERKEVNEIKSVKVIE